MVRRASPVLRIKESSKEPGKYVLIFKSKGLVNLRFSIGPFENGGEGVPERRIDGVMFNTKFWIDDDGKLSHISSHSEGTLPDMTGSREIDSDGRLKATGSCCGYTVVQYCERVPDEDEETDSKL
ncbi:uncharacterized protein LOC142351876 [Convolutriloba macropyga]|uniref:uncharacterized protein LOC142351876 n=1 Tax=Convolutriloba macropyga TaxID=536237 RepID=UPI003F51CCC2